MSCQVTVSYCSQYETRVAVTVRRISVGFVADSKLVTTAQRELDPSVLRVDLRSSHRNSASILLQARKWRHVFVHLFDPVLSGDWGLLSEVCLRQLEQHSSLRLCR